MASIKYLNERYQLKKVIKENEKVTIYQAQDHVLQTSMIIKEMKNNEKKPMGDFELLKNVKHIGLPIIYDAFMHHEKRYIVIEKIEGESLHQKIDKEKTLSEKRSLQYIKDLLLTVDYLHKMNPKPIYHGDIHPQNVICNSERIVLIDFDSIHEQVGMPGFIPPEYYLTNKKSVQTDIYSLGALLYYMLTGKKKKIYEKYEDDALSLHLQEIIQKATKKNPKERYSTAESMIHDVERMLQMPKMERQKNIKTKILHFFGCKEMGCEFGYVFSKQKCKTVVLDMDSMNPGTEYLMGIKNRKSNEYMRINDHLDLFCLDHRLEAFENLSVRKMQETIYEQIYQYQLVILLTNDFLYDAFTLCAVFASDHIIFPIQKGLLDIEKFNRYAQFLNQRQSIDPQKFHYCQFDYSHLDLRKHLTSKTVLGHWAGCIPASKKRKAVYNMSGCYAKNMEKKVKDAYLKMGKRLAL